MIIITMEPAMLIMKNKTTKENTSALNHELKQDQANGGTKSAICASKTPSKDILGMFKKDVASSSNFVTPKNLYMSSYEHATHEMSESANARIKARSVACQNYMTETQVARLRNPFNIISDDEGNPPTKKVKVAISTDKGDGIAMSYILTSRIVVCLIQFLHLLTISYLYIVLRRANNHKIKVLSEILWHRYMLIIWKFRQRGAK